MGDIGKLRMKTYQKFRADRGYANLETNLMLLNSVHPYANCKEAEGIFAKEGALLGRCLCETANWFFLLAMMIEIEKILRGGWMSKSFVDEPEKVIGDFSKAMCEKEDQTWMTLDALNTIVCASCGWIGQVENLNNGTCPMCKYENGEDVPGRLLTLKEIVETKEKDWIWCDVNLGAFLESVFKVLGIEI